MKIQIFQHLPALPKAGIFCPSPILCVTFRAFIPDRSVFRCFPLPCLSMFRPLVPMHKSAHSVTHPAAPPSHAPATPITTPAASQCPHTLAPAAALPAQATTRQHQEQRTCPRRCTATAPRSRTLTPHTKLQHTPTHRHPPPHFPHRPSGASARDSTPPRHHAACRFSQPHTPAKKPPPPHTQASKKDCPAQEQSFL